MQLHEMSFQQRLMLTIAVCIGLVLLWPFVFPPPATPLEGELDAGAEVATADRADAGEDGAESGDADAPASKGPSPVAPPSDPASPAGGVDFQPEEHTLSNGVLEVAVTSRFGGMVTDLRALDPQFRDEDGTPLDFLLLEGERTLVPGFVPEATDFGLSKVGAAEVIERSERVFARRRVTPEVELTERLELLEGYEATLTVELRNVSGVAQRHKFSLDGLQGELEDNNRYDLHRGLCLFRGDQGATRWLMKHADGELNEGDVHWGGVDTNYFLQAFVPRDYGAVGCVFSKTEGDKHMRGGVVAASEELAPGAVRRYETALFLGAKRQELLEGFGQVPEADLGAAIYWGWFGGVSRFLGQIMLSLLRWFHAMTGVWGVAIILLTVLVKTLLFPLTVKQMKSMQKMREIQPELEKLRKKYADDKAKQQQELQALMQRTGANPMAGCLPALVQLPVFIALYASLQAAVELYHEPFLWMADLTQPDPYFILPVGMGIMMWANGKLQPVADNDQARIMQTTMPVIFTVMMLFLPAGLTVYIFANTAVSVVTTLVYLRPGQKKDVVETTAS